MLKEFTIDRSVWLLPETSLEDSSLLADDGKMCCLGQYANACGVKDRYIKNVSSFEDLAPSKRSRFYSIVKEFLEDNHISSPIYNENNVISRTIISINDTAVGSRFTRYSSNPYSYSDYIVETGDIISTQKQKESLLKKEFKKLGIKVKFVGKLNYVK